MSRPPGPGRLAVASAALLGGFCGFAALRGDRRVFAYLLVWSVLAALVRAVHRRWPLRPPTIAALWLAGAVHLAGGLLPSPTPGTPVLYETWLVPGVLKFDQVAHAAISAVVTVALAEVLGRLLDPAAAGPAVRATLAAVCCWGLGAANELFEFLSTLRFADSFAGDLTNAGWDLAFNTVGSSAAALVLVVLAAYAPSGSGDMNAVATETPSSLWRSVAIRRPG